jgi:hypothetical protein
MITGGGYQGKTETACEIAAAFEDAWLDLHQQLNPAAVRGTRDLHSPVAYVQTPVTAKPKSLCRAILDFYGADHAAQVAAPELNLDLIDNHVAELDRERSRPAPPASRPTTCGPGAAPPPIRAPAGIC